ncbi:MAG: MlaD family protein [Vicinamibacterales bacterium]
MGRSRSVVIGAFLVGGFLLFAGGLFLIGDRRLLFADQFELHTTFGKVTGLQIGSAVRLAGLDAGEVVEITIPSRPSQRFDVRMRVREDVRQLIRTDSVGSVQTDGLVGSTFIQISPGSDAALVVPQGGAIPGRDPVEFADLIQEGRETFRTVTREIIDLKNDLSETVVALNGLVATTDGLIGNTNDKIGAMAATSTRAVEDMRGVLADAKAIVEGVKAGRGTVGQLVTDDTLYRRMTGIGQEAEQTMKSLREAAEHGRTLMSGLAAPDGNAQQVIETLRNTLTHAQDVAVNLSESTEALKRNFLFRGFFRDRGFYDLGAISREAYLDGALEGDDRTALRIWLDADGLFTTGSDGTEQLTEAGRQRLDSAMADFVRYPRNSPLMIEGYATGAEGDPAFARSTHRAAIVRDHIVTRFRRQATLVEIMPMGGEAKGSPSGDGRWSGVALALFVRNDALASDR